MDYDRENEQGNMFDALLHDFREDQTLNGKIERINDSGGIVLPEGSDNYNECVEKGFSKTRTNIYVLFSEDHQQTLIDNKKGIILFDSKIGANRFLRGMVDDPKFEDLYLTICELIAFYRDNRVNESVETNKNIKTLYRGTGHENDFLINDMVWVSADIDVARGYGEILYELEIDLKNCFNSLDLENLKLIYKNGLELSDDYLEKNDIDEMGLDARWDEGVGVIFNSAEAFYHSPATSDTWNAIEFSPGVLGWIESIYDSVLITEGGSEENYILFDPKNQVLNSKIIT